MTGSAPFRAALVDPPFGSASVPGLGLALISAGLRQRGIACRTFFWNLDFAKLMYGDMPGRKLRAYQSLTGKTWYPYNEWIFARSVHGERIDPREPETRQRMRERAASLERPNVPLSRILKLREMADEIVDAMCDRLAAYPVVGIGTTFFQNLPALALAQRLKQRWPEKIVVLGGANCDGEMGRALLDRFPFLDCAFSGEADHAFPEFAVRISQGAGLDGIAGLHRRGSGGEAVSGPAASPIVNMDGLPLPSFDDYVEARNEAGIHGSVPVALPIESSRGCWWGERQHCTFCGLNANGMEYRRKSHERFQWEVEEMKRRYGVKYLFVTDNILAMDYYETFLRWSAGSELGLRYFYEIKSNVKRRHAERLSAGGVTAIQPGIEHFSTRILTRMRKGVTGIQNVACLKYTREEGVLLTYNLLVGFPGEEQDEYARIVKQFPRLAHLRPPAAMTEVEFHRFSPYHSNPAEFGLRLVPSHGYDALYPFETGAIAKLAYFFEQDGTRPERSYLRPVYDALVAWGKAFREDDCTLVWSAMGAEIAVEDRRPGFGPCSWVLSGFAARLFEFLDEPRAVRAVKHFAEQQGGQGALSSKTDGWSRAFDAAEVAAAPEQALAPLVEAGLLYEEDNPGAGDLASLGQTPEPVRYYLALPVRQTRRAVDPGWLELGV